MPDENKPDGSLDEELQSENGVDESAAGADGTVDDGADAAAADESGDMGQDDVDAMIANQAAEEASDAGDVAVDTVEENVEGGDGFEKVVNPDDASEDDAEAEMLKMLEEEAGDEPMDEFPDLSGVQMEQPAANPVEFQQLSPSSGQSADTKNIDMLLDVKMPISIELGRTDMAISDLLALGPGSVVELNKLAGEPVDLLVNNVVIAKGEVVVVDENFGVRVTLLMSPEERLKSMAQQ